MPDRRAARAARPAARRWAFLVFCGVVCLSLLAAWRQEADNRARTERRFHEEAERVGAELVTRMQTYAMGLRGARGVVMTAGDLLSRRLFLAYIHSRDAMKEFPGARGFGFVRRVARADEASFLARARHDGRAHFAVHELGKSSGERWIIEYIEPEDANRAALGLDIASEPRRFAAAREAMLSGKAVLTAPITLVQAKGFAQHGFLLLLPVYAIDSALETPEQRAAATVGWTYVPLLIDEVIEGFGLWNGRLSWMLTDVTAGSPPTPFMRSAVKADERTAFSVRLELPMFGRRWRLTGRPTARFMEELNLTDPHHVVAAGTLLAVLLSALWYLVYMSRQRAMWLRAQQAQLSNLVENSSDAIVAESLEGAIIGWNRAAEQIFGYSAAEAIGRPAESLDLGEHSPEERALLERARRGEQLSPYDAVRVGRSGTQLDLSIALSPILALDGRIVGIAKTIRNVGERKRAERQLHEFNAQLEREVRERTRELESAKRDLQTILDAIPSLIGYWDKDLINRFANHAYQEWFGFSARDLPGKHMRELLGEALFSANTPHIERALSGEPQSFSRTLTRPDGQSREVLSHYLPDLVDGQVRGFYVLVHDVTALQRSQRELNAALRENQRLLAALHQSALVSVTDQRGRIIDVNDKLCEVSGYTREELIGKTHRVISSGVHPKEFWEELWGRISSGKVWTGEITNRAKDGSLYYVDSLIAPFFDESGKIERYVSIRSDVTERRNALDELARERKRLDNILRGTNVGTWEWNVQTGETRFNERWAEIIGYRLEELEPTSIETWISHAHPDDLPRSSELLQRHFSGELSYYECELRMRHRDGSSVWVLDRGRVFTWTADGKPEWMYGTHQDVTERHQVEEALRDAKRVAEAASAAKSEFLANVSHEIRTPLNAVIGLSHLLERTALSAEQSSYLGKIQSSGRLLLGVINDVLDLSKIEAGEMTLEETSFELSSILEELRQMTAPQAQAKALDLVIPEAPQAARWLRGDAMRLTQVLSNLLSNAIKFTERGRVELSVRAEQVADERVQLRFAVRDTGIGIAPDALSRLFTPFTQADASTTRRFGGTGLGLSIVKRLAEMMRGAVGVNSTPGQGSEFWVELTLASGTPTAGRNAVTGQNPGARAESLSGVRVLLVDDSSINIEVARAILEYEGVEVTACANGAEALEELAKRGASFDLVLMDVQMPVMDGNEATRRIRAELGLRELPIIALTAGALVAERQRALNAGMNDFLTKPLDPEALVRSVKSYAAPTRELPPAGEAARPKGMVGETPWPQIEGIDGEDAARRTMGDQSLFKGMLQRMLQQHDEFVGGVVQAPTSDEERRQLTMRIHKLRGSAGMLGARRVHQLAGDLEHSLDQGQSWAELEPKLAELRVALNAIAASARPLFALDRVLQTAQRQADAALPCEALRALMDALRSHDLGALAQFETLSPQLGSYMDSEAFERVRAAITRLDFGEAVRALEPGLLSAQAASPTRAAS